MKKKNKNKQINKNINFVPEFMIREKNAIKRLFIVGIATAVFTLVSFGVYFVPELKIFTLTEQIKNADKEIEFYKDVEVLYKKLNDTEKKLKEKKKIIQEISKNDIDVAALMDKLISAEPQGVQMTYMSITDKMEVAVSYVINNPIEANSLVENLVKLNIFEQVNMPDIPIVDRKTDISFRLKLIDSKIKK
ncbi:MAG: hypothetical protein ACM3KR_05110 [Deltaproteobacteria bacterium]